MSFSVRAQKTMGLSSGSPTYQLVDAFQKPDAPAKSYVYSPDGVYFAYAVPGSVKIHTSADAAIFQELPVQAAVDLNFSPLGTFLSTWERIVKLEDGAQHKNLRVWKVATGEEVTSFTQKNQDEDKKWDLQYTSNESHAVRTAGPDIQVFSPSDWAKGVVDKLKVEGLTSISLSPGRNPTIAVFVGEKKGAPASVALHGLTTLAAPPTCKKSFYKADSVTIKWNPMGTQLLLLSHADVDKTNKSYYGETNLMLLSSAGNFDCRVPLDKEGPIHDFEWSPNSKEFGVVYGYMPAKASLFDQRAKVTTDFGANPWNFIRYNPQARLLALAGFGNLAGKIDIFDRRTLNKVCQIDAPNSSYCEWSNDGKTLLTATLSPRLRVDNGIKIWHCSGPLLHVQMIDELYQASWKRLQTEKAPPFPANIPPAPAASADAQALSTVVKATPTKPAGAYRPPGARGGATPSIYKREDEGGMSYSPSNGSPNPSRTGTPANARFANGSSGREVPGAPPRHRAVPGAPPPGSGGPSGSQDNKRGKKKGKKDGATGGDAEVPPPITIVAPPPLAAPIPETPGADAGLDPLAKKVRNLNKKLKAIEELKERVAKGDKLEATQLKKIEGEAEIRRELQSLGA
ncbi:translation initiation factor eIF-2A [Clavulina sp. PMI_390]|nr:translation initiation factor eIF-2A [Clavulina sp. PMI_390]